MIHRLGIKIMLIPNNNIKPQLLKIEIIKNITVCGIYTLSNGQKEWQSYEEIYLKQGDIIPVFKTFDCGDFIGAYHLEWSNHPFIFFPNDARLIAHTIEKYRGSMFCRGKNNEQ